MKASSADMLRRGGRNDGGEEERREKRVKNAQSVWVARVQEVVVLPPPLAQRVNALAWVKGTSQLESEDSHD